MRLNLFSRPTHFLSALANNFDSLVIKIFPKRSHRNTKASTKRYDITYVASHLKNVVSIVFRTDLKNNLH